MRRPWLRDWGRARQRPELLRHRPSIVFMKASGRVRAWRQPPAMATCAFRPRAAATAVSWRQKCAAGAEPGTPGRHIRSHRRERSVTGAPPSAPGAGRLQNQFPTKVADAEGTLSHRATPARRRRAPNRDRLRILEAHRQQTRNSPRRRVGRLASSRPPLPNRRRIGLTDAEDAAQGLVRHASERGATDQAFPFATRDPPRLPRPFKDSTGR